MPEVGIRQLRDNLSRFVRQVAEGSELTVTDHGRAVARLIPIDQPRLIDRLIDEGLVSPPAETKRSRPRRRIKASQPVTPLVADQRR